MWDTLPLKIRNKITGTFSHFVDIDFYPTSRLETNKGFIGLSHVLKIRPNLLDIYRVSKLKFLKYLLEKKILFFPKKTNSILESGFYFFDDSLAEKLLRFQWEPLDVFRTIPLMMDNNVKYYIMVANNNDRIIGYEIRK